jgi:predicted nucleic acid-binding protein
MKKYVLDTNAVIYFLRDEALHKTLANELSLYKAPNLAIVSVVTLGELKAMALKNNWGERKIEILQGILSEFVVADINSEQVLNNYALLDAFSQNRLKNQPLPSSSRNMGKNDLWIAATTLSAEATLITSDNDFNHLENTFFEVIKIKM